MVGLDEIGICGSHDCVDSSWVVSTNSGLSADASDREDTAHSVSHRPFLIFAKPAMSHCWSMMRYMKALQRLQQSKKPSIPQSDRFACRNSEPGALYGPSQILRMLTSSMSTLLPVLPRSMMSSIFIILLARPLGCQN